MRVLAIESSGGGASAAMLQAGATLASGQIAAGHGLSAALPALMADLLGRAGTPDLVAVIVGPGSFTGLRAGLSVAQGIALGCGVPAIGVTVAESLAEAAATLRDGRTLWTAVTARRGRVFLHRGSAFEGYDNASLPMPSGRIALCGDAANQVAAALAARGGDVMLTDLRHPMPEYVAAVAGQRLEGRLAPLAALPLYIDAPEARTPTLRAAPGVAA